LSMFANGWLSRASMLASENHGDHRPIVGTRGGEDRALFDACGEAARRRRPALATLYGSAIAPNRF